tara:strand:+ start:181 stop:408 length:228 start_codon:yes stop_codon:yes gene_type:complete
MNDTKKIYTAQIVFTQGHDLYGSIPWATEKELSDSIEEALSYSDAVNVIFTPAIKVQQLNYLETTKIEKDKKVID